VPLDPVQPPERLRRILDDSRASVILVAPGTVGIPAPADVTVLVVDAVAGDVGAVDARTASPSPGDVALVAYTSGPHGAPVGVELSHGVLSSTVDAVREVSGLGAHDRLLATGEVSSGRSVLEVWLALGAGSALICTDAADAGSLREVAERCRATAMHADPDVWQRLVDAGWSGGAGFLALSSGAAVPLRLAAELAGRVGRAYSLYGMAESGFWAGLVSLDDVTAPGHLGKPLGDRRWYVVDRRLQPVPPGVPGELLVGGTELACGYLGDPEPAATRFLPDPWSGLPGARLVRTGDRVRVRDGDAVMLLGVEDGRLAVRGLRVEALEVERALGRHPAVREAAVTAFEQWGERRLMAHIVNRPDEDYTHSELRRHLRALLPDHMVPRRFVEVDGLPRRGDGSVDRARLATVDDDICIDATEPRTEGERLLASLWRDALGVTTVGVHDNFFDLGGHSLLCLQVIAQLEGRIGRRLSPRLLLLNTLEQVAAHLGAAVGPSTAGARAR
jgi:acyl-coenzyme A synthetase/AMP-(fatty) acid ligase